MNTREKIIAKAKHLFNESGYSRTTMRDISRELSISPGNLTYYFPKKASLIDAITEECIGNLVADREVNDFHDFHQLLDDTLISLVDNRFYFISDESRAEMPKLQKEYIRNCRKVHLLFTQALGSLRSRRLIRMEDEQIEAFSTMILLAHITWISPERTYHSGMQKDAFLKMHMQLLLPYCTAKGKKEIQNYL